MEGHLPLPVKEAALLAAKAEHRRVQRVRAAAALAAPRPAGLVGNQPPAAAALVAAALVAAALAALAAAV